MNVEMGSLEEHQAYWNYSGTHTYNYFVEGINNKKIEFWKLLDEDTIVGQLYIFWDSDDPDEANGVNRAYLCAFDLKEDYRGKGYGSLLMRRIFERVLEVGYSELTIGIDNDDFDKLKGMYNHFGFTELVKMMDVDLHGFDQFGNHEIEEEPYMLLMKKL